MTLDQWTTFLGWATAIHFGFLIVMTLFLVTARGWVAKIHSGMFGLEKAQLPMVYFGYAAIYKLLIITFAFVPYLVLRLAM